MMTQRCACCSKRQPQEEETLRAQIEGVLQSAHRLALAGRHGEAIDFLHGSRRR